LQQLPVRLKTLLFVDCFKVEASFYYEILGCISIICLETEIIESLMLEPVLALTLKNSIPFSLRICSCSPGSSASSLSHLLAKM